MVIAQITTEGEPSDLKQVLRDFNGDLTVTHRTDSPSSEIVELRASEGELLSQFHETCVEHGIALTIRRIYHEPDQTDEPAGATANSQTVN